MGFWAFLISQEIRGLFLIYEISVFILSSTFTFLHLVSRSSTQSRFHPPNPAFIHPIPLSSTPFRVHPPYSAFIHPIPLSSTPSRFHPLHSTFLHLVSRSSTPFRFHPSTSVPPSYPAPFKSLYLWIVEDLPTVHWALLSHHSVVALQSSARHSWWQLLAG